MGTKTYRVRRKVAYGECDFAGVAYWPAVMSWLMDAKMEWFDDDALGLGYPYRKLLEEDRVGFYTLRVNSIDFQRPLLLRREYEVRLEVKYRESYYLRLEFTIHDADGAVCVIADLTLVCAQILDRVDEEHHPHKMPIPPHIAHRIDRFQHGDTASWQEN